MKVNKSFKSPDWVDKYPVAMQYIVAMQIVVSQFRRIISLLVKGKYILNWLS